MSGGAFDYKQYQINSLIEEMEDLLIRIEKDSIDTYECDSLKEYIDDHDSFKAIVLTNIQHLKMAKIYTERLDWFISGDDGEDSFYKRIEEDISKI